MVLLILLFISEILAVVVIKQHFSGVSKRKFYTALIIHFILSIWLWIIFIEIFFFKGPFDDPRHIWQLMNLTGMICAVVAPRLILIMFHFSGKLLRIKSGGHLLWLTNTGLIIMVTIFSIIAVSTFFGRFNFKTESVTIKIKGLHKDIEGLKIVHLSDMHLAGFYQHNKLLQKVMLEVNSYNPDLILNTGDFVSYGWREFDRNDTILVKAKSKCGNLAVMGNHDFGTYHPKYSEAERDTNVMMMNKQIIASGYKVLNDENSLIKVGEARIAVIGIITKGRHPDIFHGDLGKAISGIDSVDLKILLSHDPNHWEKSVTGKTDIDITLSGHTHGMQMGVLTKDFRWSPSKYFYPHWNGLYSEKDQFQYVNRGLGTLAIPFRIWMPPEITLITLKSE
jgi:predicted MPP superfamily phosphohydrolase